MLLEVALIGIEHTVEPRKELLGAVVGVKDNGDTVGGSNAADVVGSGDGTSDGGLLAIVVGTLQWISSILRSRTALQAPRLVPFQQSRQHHPERPGG